MYYCNIYAWKLLYTLHASLWNVVHMQTQAQVRTYQLCCQNFQLSNGNWPECCWKWTQTIIRSELWIVYLTVKILKVQNISVCNVHAIAIPHITIFGNSRRFLHLLAIYRMHLACALMLEMLFVVDIGSLCVCVCHLGWMVRSRLPLCIWCHVSYTYFKYYSFCFARLSACSSIVYYWVIVYGAVHRITKVDDAVNKNELVENQLFYLANVYAVLVVIHFLLSFLSL